MKDDIEEVRSNQKCRCVGEPYIRVHAMLQTVRGMKTRQFTAQLETGEVLPDMCESFQCFRTRSSSGWQQRHINGLHTHLSTSRRTSTTLAQVLMPKMFPVDKDHSLCGIALILESQIVHGLPKMPKNVHGVPKHFLLIK